MNKLKLKQRIQELKEQRSRIENKMEVCEQLKHHAQHVYYKGLHDQITDFITMLESEL